MNHITYLFGAGASALALPIVNQIPARIKLLIDDLKKDELLLDHTEEFQDLQIPKSKRDLQLEMIVSLEWLLVQSQKHASVDTFAKKLSIKDKYNDLKKLKIALSIFFIFEQIKTKVDPRYDTFFASILDTLSYFPENLNILSWNYDYQFELAYSEYTDNHEISYNQRSLGVNTKYNQLKENRGFGIYKLNGTTGFSTDGGWRQYVYADNLKLPLDKNIVERITRGFAVTTYLSQTSPGLSFAWEPENNHNSIIDRCLEITREVDVLVIIGYSFPFFNREIDRKIIGNMQKLRKVYFQAPDANIIRERFMAIRDDIGNIEFVEKYDLEQFILPNEL